MLYVCLQAVETPREKVKLEQIYLRYKDYMLYAANSILHNQRDAEDAVQEAFLDIAANLAKFSDPESDEAQALILLITERKAVNIYRGNKRRAREVSEEIEETILWAPEPGENTLANCISRLPERERNAILLRYSHGYHIDEIAKMLGLSYAAAAKLVERAKKKLERMCEEEGLL